MNLDEATARTKLIAATELYRIWKGYATTFETMGAAALTSGQREILEADSETSHQKIIELERKTKQMKAAARISAQKSHNYALDELKKYSVKPGKNRFFREGGECFMESTHAVGLPQEKNLSLPEMGMKFRSFLSKEGIKNLDSTKVVEHLREYRKCVTQGKWKNIKICSNNI